MNAKTAIWNCVATAVKCQIAVILYAPCVNFAECTQSVVLAIIGIVRSALL